MHRIPPPVGAPHPRVRFDGLSPDVQAQLESAREAMLAAAHAEVSAYVSDPTLTFSPPDQFPSTQRLTGDYYISDECYTTDSASGRHRVSILARCLAHPLPAQSEPDDYLGLEVWLEWHPESTSFSVFRNTDSSVI